MVSHLHSPILRWAAIVAGALLSTAACSDEATAPRKAPRIPPAISAVDNPDLGKNAVVSPILDGVITPGEYKGGASFSFDAQIPAGLLYLTTPVTVHVKRDETYLYLAASFDRKSPIHPHDHVSFEFDNDADGVREDGDDVLLSSASSAPNVPHAGADFYRYNNGQYNQSDAGGAGTVDVLSVWGAVGNKAVFELRQPLNNSDDAHDISVDASSGPVTIGLQTMVALEKGPIGSGEFLRSFKPSFTTYCQLTIGDLKVMSVSCP